jgi:hypothetical protein
MAAEMTWRKLLTTGFTLSHAFLRVKAFRVKGIDYQRQYHRICRFSGQSEPFPFLNQVGFPRQMQLDERFLLCKFSHLLNFPPVGRWASISLSR